MTLEFSPWVALVLGILIGWLFGWFLDLWFDRRRGAEDERRRAELEELRQLRDLQLADVGTPAVALRGDMLRGDMLRGDTMSAEAAIEEEPLPPLQAELLAEGLTTPALEVENVDVDEDAPPGAHA